MNDNDYMQLALNEAQEAFDAGEIPIGAVLVQDDQVIAVAHNTREQSLNPLHHAEMIVLEEGAKKLKNWRLNDCTLYVTLEPCPMCLGASLQARIGRLVYGAKDDKRRNINERTNGQTHEDTSYQFPSLDNLQEIEGNNHTIKINSGVMRLECVTILQSFFKDKRIKGNI
ncbi:nucleoside deaminase [bacterium]|nr:nucleoside deaminase [bacterium]